MLETLARKWWALALRGLMAMLFGLLAFFTFRDYRRALDSAGSLYLSLLFGAYALVDGIFNVIAFIRVASHQRPLLIEGVIGVSAGTLIILWPGIILRGAYGWKELDRAVILIGLIMFWLVFRGVLEIIAGIRLRRAITNEWLLLVMGALSLLFVMLPYVILILLPDDLVLPARTVVLWIGGYAFLFGISLLALAFRLRWYRQEVSRGAAG
jgi:uncharacterized membrane protein HdeD (DUF308 family)